MNAWFCKLPKWGPFKSEVNAKSALTRKYFFITTVSKQSLFSHITIGWRRGLLLCSEVAYKGGPAPRVLPSYTGKLEIPDGKSSGSHHSI